MSYQSLDAIQKRYNDALRNYKEAYKAFDAASKKFWTPFNLGDRKLTDQGFLLGSPERKAFVDKMWASPEAHDYETERVKTVKAGNDLKEIEKDLVRALKSNAKEALVIYNNIRKPLPVRRRANASSEVSSRR